MSTLWTRSNIYNKKYLNMYFCLKRHFRWIHTIIPLQVSDVFIIHPQKILNINAFKLSELLHNFFFYFDYPVNIFFKFSWRLNILAILIATYSVSVPNDRVLRTKYFGFFFQPELAHCVVNNFIQFCHILGNRMTVTFFFVRIHKRMNSIREFAFHS